MTDTWTGDEVSTAIRNAEAFHDEVVEAIMDGQYDDTVRARYETIKDNHA